MNLRLVPATLLLSLPAFALQSVHVVQSSGAALQTAIDSALDGDTVLVRGGSYTTCSISGKGLTVVSDPAGATTVQSVRISGTVAGQACVVSGLHVRTPALTAAPSSPSCIVLTSCAGSVRLEALTNQILTPHGTPAVYVEACDDVALARCTLTGSNGTSVTGDLVFFASIPGAGLEAVASRVAAHECSIRGGDGNDGSYFTQQIPYFPFPPTSGASGAEVRTSATLVANAGQLRGGDGGNGLPGHCNPSTGLPVAGGPAANGGAGLRAEATASAYVRDTSLVAGPGGSGVAGGVCTGMPATAGANGVAGSSSVGPLITFAGTATTLACPTHVRSGQSIPLAIGGTPGDSVIIASSRHARWELVPFYEGAVLFDVPVRRVPAGLIPGSGSLVLALTADALLPGELARVRHFQAFARTPSGATRLGSFGVVTILDPSF